jgi:hypothetical protein
MALIKNPGRHAGLLYILASIFGIFALLYVPAKISVAGDPAATAANLAAHERLFRLGIVSDLIGQAIFVLVALALYNLLKPVNHRLALMMLVLILVAIPIAFLNELNSVAALAMSRGDGLLSTLGQQQRYAWARFFLDLRGSGFEIAGIFWGAWLFPLGLLVYRSKFIPRFLGVMLMIGCFGYLANSFTSLVLPQDEAAVSRWADPVQAVELIFMVWLAIFGTKPSNVTTPGV